MSRQPLDVEELFRELTRRGERARKKPARGAGGAGPRKPGPRPAGGGTVRRLGWLVAAFFVGMLALSTAANVFTEWLWFESLGHEAVYQLRLLAPWLLFLVLWLLGTAWLAMNVLLAGGRVAKEARFPGQQVPWIGGLGLRAVLLVASAVGSALVAMGAAPHWERLLLWYHRTPFDIADPLLGRDVGFYVWELPVWHWAHVIAWTWWLLAVAATVGVYALGGALEFRRGLPRIVAQARVHLSLLGAVGALLWAGRQWLARYDLLFGGPPTGAFSGPGFADATVRMPGLAIAAAAGVVLALGLVIFSRLGPLWLPAALIAIAVGVRVVAVGVVPSLVQQLRVTPNELQRETPYIANNITMTLRAYGLHEVDQVSYRPDGKTSTELFERHTDTISNVRLWDWRVLQSTFRQLQEIRPYYEFFDVDVDRYQVGDGTRQVLLSAREMTSSVLSNQTWVNRHLKFTHGHGIVVTPVDEVTPQGLPRLWARDIPVRTVPPFDHEITQPRIYFGESYDNPYVIVGTLDGEIDYSVPRGDFDAADQAVGAEPGSEQDIDESSATVVEVGDGVDDGVATNFYDGADGVSLASRWRRFLFAARTGDIEIMLSDQIIAESRILVRRHIRERVESLAPFLTFDNDPYLVLSDEGRLVWILDAYTSSDGFPYSRRVRASGVIPRALNGATYVRNSVKVTIDAYDGNATFYIVDPDDPLVAAWERIYPSLFKPVGEMSTNLVAHWRYPEALFSVQTEIYSRYHMDNPAQFYNAEDLWVVPTETFEQGTQRPVDPYYITMRLRGEDQAEFLLMQPFTPVNKQNLIAWLAARSDPPHYGKMVAYRFGSGEQYYGPQQVESRIDQDTDIAQQLTLWSQSGSQVIRGNLLIIPIEDTLLYVEPLYLRAAESGSALPELKRVIVADAERVVMRETLNAALAALVARSAPAVVFEEPGAAFDGPSAAEAPVSAPAIEPGARPPAPPSRPPLLDLDGATLADLVRAARESERAAAEAISKGDWRSFGEAMDRLQSILDQLEEATGGPLPDGAAAPNSDDDDDDDDNGDNAP